MWKTEQKRGGRGRERKRGPRKQGLLSSSLRRHHEADPFLNKLKKLYERNKTFGSVWVTVKRCKLSKLCTRLNLCICSPFYQSIRPVQTKLGVLHLGSVA
ncbi:hypothetical protein BDL97_18G030500 [Sphagnum fallax]|nr:hypothetical protein BDL97_18G030500 [Sphagnum fallax]